LVRRRDERIALDQELQTAYLCRLVGKQLDLLVEGKDAQRPSWVRGTTCRKVTAVIEGGAGLIRKRVPVMALRVESDRLVAQRVEVGDDVGVTPSNRKP